MKCPTCDTDMIHRPHEQADWCPRCGTISIGDLVTTPVQWWEYQHLLRKIAHGCTDGLCEECDA